METTRQTHIIRRRNLPQPVYELGAEGELGGVTTARISSISVAPQADPPPPYSVEDPGSAPDPNITVTVERVDTQDIHNEGLSSSPQNYVVPSSSPATPESTSNATPAKAREAGFPPPSRQSSFNSTDDDPSNPVHYTRDPHKLIAYLIPFPKPRIPGINAEKIPDRFLIYTPPPPPLTKPADGEESRIHKTQRKWQEEVRKAKQSKARTLSWKGLRSKTTRGIDKAMSAAKTSSIDFLNRLPEDALHCAGGDCLPEGQMHQAIGLKEIVLVYPSSIPGTEEEIRAEFVNTMLRTKTQAQRDAIIATGLIPLAAAIDFSLMVVWPFGGLLEIDSVWAYISFRGAKASRSVTTRLTSPCSCGHHEDDSLRLSFKPSNRLDTLTHYLLNQCFQRELKMFAHPGIMTPSEDDVLKAIGWLPSQSGGSTRNWEDEEWETAEVKDDWKNVISKGAREWTRWCKLYEKSPLKALKK